MRRRAPLLAVVLLAACATVAPRIEEPVVMDRLYCGLSIPGGGTVSDAEWEAFVGEVVTPRFPDGFTVYRAEGQWRNADGTIGRESSMIIEVVHPIDLRFDRFIAEIAEEYRRRFRQEAVLRVTLPARMELFD